MDILEGTSRVAQDFGCTGVQSTDGCQTTQQRTNRSMTESVHSVAKLGATDTAQNASKFNQVLRNEPSQYIKKRSHTVKTRQIMSARQMQKLIKND